MLGRSCADNILRHVDAAGRELCLDGCPLEAVVQDGRMHEAQVYLHHKLGHRVPVHVRATALRDPAGHIQGAVETFRPAFEKINVLHELQKLRKEVLRDPLTGVGNRRYAEMCLQECEKNAKEHGVPYGVLMVDIDHFKAVNDTWGHGVGDKVLRMVAAVLDGSVRGLDAACRWGGEEFVVLCRNTSTDGLRAVAERLRMLVEKSWLDHQGKQIAVTVSIGGAISRPGETAEAVVDRADQQLYRSKNEGRNRVSLEG
ncbi:GGDEF domain-containing protein [Desulfosoma caldarium]|uniref:GGDEF domain-containing protein n=1 Tax=Desulfosoma caldarium TaxID=610254 RepID=UPI001B87ED66